MADGIEVPAFGDKGEINAAISHFAIYSFVLLIITCLSVPPSLMLA